MKKANPLLSQSGKQPLFLTNTPDLKNSLTHKTHGKSIFKQGLPLAMLFFLAAFAPTERLAAQYCTMACNNLINVSLPAECEAEILYDMIMENANNPISCSPTGDSAFVVTIMDQVGFTIPSSPFVTADYIGQTLTVRVKHIATNNSCWGSIFVEDHLPPQLICPPNDTIACADDVSPANTGQIIATDCSSFDLDYTDMVQMNGCSTAFSGIITRSWVAWDIYGNVSSCSQTIYIEKPSANEVMWPPNRDGIAAPALDCVNPNTSPANTGKPTINGQIIPGGTGFCNMAVTFSDQQIALCQNSYKILRTWTVVAWCTGTILNHTQIIAVKDTHAPTLVCPSDLTVGTTSSVVCKATVTLPSVAITDDCSTTFTVTMNTPVGLINGNGGTIYNVNPGIYTIQYNVLDNCGNLATCTFKLTVKDDDVPVVICDAFTTVTLTNNGFAVVFANTFDDGSYDNCSPITLTARRMVAACGTLPTFAPTVKFCCDDVNDDIQVEMKATDVAGNSNSCMVIVHVDDKTNPVLTCPADITITCNQDPESLEITGEPTVTDACGVASVTYSDAAILNTCHVGSIVRSWFAEDVNGNSGACSHTITVVDNTPVIVTFPPNYAVTGCVNISNLDPANLPAPYNAPVITKDCELMATSYTDQVFQVAAPACFQILRKWKVINWCTYVAGGTVGLWQGTQILMVTDLTAPVFTCPNDFTVGVGSNCKATVTLPQVTNIQDCSQNVGVTVTSPFGNGYGPFQNVNPGLYTVTYHVSDGCNNVSNCSIEVTVQDDKPPTPYCKAGLVIELMPVDTDGDGVIDDGMIQTWANDFDDNSSDNCPGGLTFSFSPDVFETGATFGCDDLGPNPVEIWVTDASGNQDFCVTTLIIQDNLGWCGGALYASVGGAVTNEQGMSMEDVMVSVNDGINPPAMTGSDGNFSFAALQLGNDYTVSPEKDTLLLNGVTTYDIVLIRRHILGMEALPSPYKIIAADVNHSNTVTTTDLVAMQKAILHVTDFFPNNKSWRFVEMAYDFPNASNPFAPAFPEVFNINDMAGALTGLSFIGIKVGDVNNSSQPNNFAPTNEDRSGETLLLEVADANLEPGKMQIIDVTVKDFQDIIGYQFTLHFDQTALEFVRIEKGELSSVDEANFGYRLLDEGVLTTSWNDFQPVSLPDDAVLFRLVFQAKTNGSLAQTLHLSSDYTVAEAYHESGEMLNIDLQFPSSFILPHSSFLIHPNPFQQSTTVGFYLPIQQEVTLTVFDAAGRQMKQVNDMFEMGYNALKIKAEELAGAGTYFFQLKTSAEVRTSKIVLTD